MYMARVWPPNADPSGASRVEKEATNIPKTGEAQMRQILGTIVA